MPVANRLTVGSSATGGSVTFTRPSAVVDGDLIVVTVNPRDIAATSTGPTGFTQLFERDSGSVASLHFWVGRAEAGVTSWAFGSSNTKTVFLLIGSYSGTKAGNPTVFATAEGNSGTPTGPAVTGVADGMIVSSVAQQTGASFTPPSGVTELADATTGTRNTDMSAAGGEKRLSAGGGTGTFAWASSASNIWVAATALIEPQTGTAHTATVSDALGASDTTATAVILGATVSDKLGASDAVSTVATLQRTVTDPLGGVDQVSRTQDFSRTQTDALGEADGVDIGLDFTSTLTSSLGVTDSSFAGIPPNPPANLGLATEAGGLRLTWTVSSTPGVTYVIRRLVGSIPPNSPTDGEFVAEVPGSVTANVEEYV